MRLKESVIPSSDPTEGGHGLALLDDLYSKSVTMHVGQEEEARSDSSGEYRWTSGDKSVKDVVGTAITELVADMMSDGSADGFGSSSHAAGSANASH